MARAAPKPKTAPKPAAKPHAPVAAKPEATAQAEPEAAPAVVVAGQSAESAGITDPGVLNDMKLAGMADADGNLTEAGAALINEHPAPEGDDHKEPDPEPEASVEAEPYTGKISPTPAHLIRMTHPGGGVSDGFQTDESGAILVPLPQVEAMKGHGFVVDHLPQPEAEAAEVI